MAVMALRRVLTDSIVPLVGVDCRVAVEHFVGEHGNRFVTLDTDDNLDHVGDSIDHDWRDVGETLFIVSALGTDTVTVGHVCFE